MLATVLLLVVSPGALAQQWLIRDQEQTTFAEIQKRARQIYNLDGEQPRSGWKQYARWRWLARTRLDPEGRFDPSLSWKQWQSQVHRPGGRLAPDHGEWTCLGPTYKAEYANAWGTRGMGRVSRVAFDPGDTSIIWVGAPSGGLWWSSDGGQTWEPRTDHLPNIGVTDILIHPEQPQILYLALGDGDAGDSVSTGMLKTDDGGLSWQMLSLGQGFGGAWWIHKLLMHPRNPDALFAATSEGVFRTTDAGQSWHLLITGYFKDIEVSPADSAVLYASRWGWGVYRSGDGGDTWQILRQGLPTAGFSRISLAVTPASPRTVYASYADSGAADPDAAQEFLGLYCSLDGGDSWTLQASSPNIFGQRTGEPGPNLYSLGNYAQVLAVDPTDANTVYAGSVNLWKSTDGGRTWRYLTQVFGSYGVAELHVDHHELVFMPGSNMVLFDCSDGGLHRSNDGGRTWTDLSAGLVIRQIYRIGISPHHPDHFIIGAQDNGTDYFNGSLTNVLGGDGMGCFVDPSDPQLIFFSYQNATLYRSADAGRTLISISNDFMGQGTWVAPFLMDPVEPATLYTATTRVMRSDDRGTTWAPISGELSGRRITVLEVAPSDPLHILASDGVQAFRSLNGGGSWTELETGDLDDVITDMAFDPGDPWIVWLTLGGYGSWNGWANMDYRFNPEKVFRSSDRGETWRDVSGSLPNIPVNCVTVDPETSTAYIGTDLGVYLLENGEGSWLAFSKGLPNVAVTDLVIDRDIGTIWAGTYGRGLWRSPLMVGSAGDRMGDRGPELAGSSRSR